MGIVTSLIEKRSWGPTEDIWYTLKGIERPTASGVRVDEIKALNYAAVWNAIVLISGAISTLPLHLYQKKERGKKKVTSNPLYGVLHSIANPEMTASILREVMTHHILSWGNCYAEIIRNGLNQVVQLWPIPPNRVRILRKNGKLFYEVSIRKKTTDMTNDLDIFSFETKILPRERVLHIPGLGFDGIRGYSVVRLASESIGLGLATEEFGARYFGEGTHPGTIVSHPGKLSETAHKNLQADLTEKYSGLGKSHRLLLLEEAMKIESIGIPPSDSQFLETRLYQIAEISRWFNLPPSKLKDLSRATFSNIEHQSIEYVVDTLVPWLVRFEQNYNMQLLTEFEWNRKLYFKHIVEGLMRGDSKTRGIYYKNMFMIGAISRNEIRDKEDMDPVDDGDEFFVPLNMIPVSKLDQLDQQPKIPSTSSGQDKKSLRSIEQRAGIIVRDRIAKRYYPLFRAAAQKIVNREGIAVKKEIKKLKKQRSKTEMQKWLGTFYRELPDYIKNTIGPVFRSFSEAVQEAAAQEIGGDIGMTEELEKFVREYTDRYVTRHIESSEGQLVSLLEEEIGELDDLEKRVDEWEEKRPDKIAANETTRNSSAVVQAVFFGTGLACVWRIRGPSTCPYCRSLDGKKVGRGESFVNDGDVIEVETEGSSMEKRGKMKINGTKAHPPLHGGCDCYLSPI